MNAVGNQALRPGQHSGCDLGEREQEIYPNADPGGARRDDGVRHLAFRRCFSVVIILGDA